MQVNNYSVRVYDGNEQDSGYVLMKHGTQYHLVLRNNNSIRCNARVEIDGKHQGTWRIPAKDSIAIERPGHDEGKFTFYEATSQEALSIGLSKEDPKLGLISVTFTPEKVRYEPELTRSFSHERSPISYGIERSASTRGMSAGGTGLSGQSSQSFGTAREMELDEDNATTINLRLVAMKNNQPRPLTNYSNPVPPPVG